MPEGFSSIADLRFVVDANTEKLNGSLALASNIVKRFSEEGTQSLGLFETATGALGGGVSALVSKSTVWLAALSTIRETMAGIRAQGDQLAALGGKTDEWQALVGSVDELLNAVEEGVPKALGRAARALADYASGAKELPAVHEGIAQSSAGVDAANEKTAETARLTSDEISAGMLELSRLSRQAGEDVIAANGKTAASFDKAGQSAADYLTDRMKELTFLFKSMADRSEWSPDTIKMAIAGTADDVENLRKHIESLQAGNITPFSIFGKDAGIERLKSQIQRDLDDIVDLTKLHNDKVSEIDAAAQAEREAAQDAAFEAATAGIQNEISALGDKAAAYGMTKGEAASYAAVMKILNELAGKEIELTEEAESKLVDLSDQLAAATDNAEALAKAKTSADATDRFLKSLDTELRTLQLHQETLGMSTTAIAAYNAEMRFRNQLADQDIKLTSAQRAEVERKIALNRDLVEAEAVHKKARADETSQDKTFDAAILGLQRQTIALQAKTAALFDGSEAGRIKALVDQQLNDLSARNVPLTEERVRAIRLEAAAQVDAARAHEQAAKSLETLRAYGTVVSSTLEGAFRKWTEGSKLDVKSMVASMLADMAQLTFKKGVTDVITSTLFGGSSGGGLLSGLFGGAAASGGDVGLGSWGATVFAGARAEGGPVNAGEMYLVGERGPEPFIPATSGTILPNDFMKALGPGSGGSNAAPSVTVVMQTTIDARYASEGTADMIKAELAARDAALPSRVVEVVQQSRDRNLI